MIRIHAITLLLRNDRVKAELGPDAPARLLHLNSEWSFDGALWALHYMSSLDLEAMIARLIPLGLTLHSKGTYQDMAIVELGCVEKSCPWLRITHEGAEFVHVLQEAS